MVVHLIPPSIVGGSVAHKPRVRRYAYGSTEWAIRNAATAGKDGIDLDLTISADGTPWVNHWDRLLERDSWMDPAGLLPRTATIRTLTDAQLSRLRWRDPDGNLWPMLTARQAMQVCVEHGIVPCFEAKGDTGRDLFYRPDWWAGFKADADEARCVPVVMSLPGGGAGARKLIAAQAAGLVTMWLWRIGSTTPTVGVDLVKSWAGRPIQRVSNRPIGPTIFEEAPVARQARSLDTLLAEVNAAAPNRDKASDGGLGDPAHAARVSDHNPNRQGVWRARDFTHDPPRMDAGKLAEQVAAMLGKHPALGSGAYVIFNRRIISTSRLREGWRRYTGSNPHTQHVHVSVGVQGYDSTEPWGVLATEPEEPKMNYVEKYREAILAGIAEAETHAEKVMDGREAFQTMRAGIKADVAARLKAGPKS